ncbi:MAG: hypothetical protein ACK41O_13685 [Runella zeae]
MQKLLFLLILIGSFGFVSDESVNSINGAFRLSQLKYQNDKDWVVADERFSIKVFKDGYWMVAKLKKGNKEFGGMGGGPYTLKDGKYNEHKYFYSWDSTGVGNTVIYDYKMSANEFKQSGKINTAKYPNYEINEIFERVKVDEPLKNDGLEGVWLMQEGYWGGTSRYGEGKYQGFMMMKIYAYPYTVYAYYDPVNKKFDGGGVCRYQFDGKTLTETNELWSWDMSRRGKSETHKITFKNGKLIQEGWEGKLREVFVKAK